MAACAFAIVTSAGVQQPRMGRFIEVTIVHSDIVRQEYLNGNISIFTGARNIRIRVDAYCTSALRWPRDFTGTEGDSKIPYWVATVPYARAGGQKTR